MIGMCARSIHSITYKSSLTDGQVKASVRHGRTRGVGSGSKSVQLKSTFFPFDYT